MTDNDIPVATQKKGMLNAALGQCVGVLASLSFTNGLMLVYLTALGLDHVRILTYLSIPNLGSGLLCVPFAIAADRWGMKRIGALGCFSAAVGFLGIAMAGTCTGAARDAIVLLGLCLFTAGQAAMTSSWYALLSPLVPTHVRGRFFGWMRFSFQVCGILFGGLSAFLLRHDPSLAMYQWVMILLTAGMFCRVGFYSRIPEVGSARQRASTPLPQAFSTILRYAGLVSFCSYVFLLALFTTACPALFGMVEKKFLQLPDTFIIWMGNLGMFGQVLGYALGGMGVDRRGAKSVFLWCHFSYGAILFLFILRGFAPPGMTALAIVLGIAHALFGLVSAASSVAISSEMLAIIPEENKALSSSVCTSLNMTGGALSGLIAAGAIKAGALNSSWDFCGQTISAYDTLLLAYGGMLILMVVTLGLVPAVLSKAQWLPTSRE